MKKIISLLLLLILGIFLVGCEKVSSTTTSFSPAKAINPGERKIKTESSTVVTTKQTETTVKPTETTIKPTTTTIKQTTTTKPVETTTTTKPIETTTTTTTQKEEEPVVINLLTYYNNTPVETSEFSKKIEYSDIWFTQYVPYKTITYYIIDRKTNEVVFELLVYLGCSYTEETVKWVKDSDILTINQKQFDYTITELRQTKLSDYYFKMKDGASSWTNTIIYISKMTENYHVYLKTVASGYTNNCKDVESYTEYKITLTASSIIVSLREQGERLNTWAFDNTDYILDMVEGQGDAVTVESESFNINALKEYAELYGE